MTTYVGVRLFVLGIVGIAAFLLADICACDCALWIAVVAFVILLVATVVLFRSQETAVRYQGIRILFERERRQVWSTHLDGYPPVWWRTLVQRCLGRAPRGVRLVATSEEAARLEELAVRAFEKKLIELQERPGAILISASVLNWPDRNNGRLQRRIECVARHPQWNFLVICRRQGILNTIRGRMLYAWPIRTGESVFVSYAPGVIAWRRADRRPVLADYRLERWMP